MHPECTKHKRQVIRSGECRECNRLHCRDYRRQNPNRAAKYDMQRKGTYQYWLKGAIVVEKRSAIRDVKKVMTRGD